MPNRGTRGRGSATAEGEAKGINVRLQVKPLLPLESDRKLAWVTVRVAEHFPESWIARSNRRGILRVSRRPVTEMAAIAVFGAVALPLVGMLMRRLTDSGTMAAASVEALVGAVFGAGIIAAVYRFSPAGSYKRHGSLLMAGGGSGPEKLGTILHELGHRMQEVIPGLVEREQAFLESKLGRRAKVYPPWKAFVLRAIGVGYSSKARNGNCFGVYRTYTAFDPLDGHAYEVFTTGLEGMEYGAKKPVDEALRSRA